jgi:hypothetical protein
MSETLAEHTHSDAPPKELKTPTFVPMIEQSVDPRSFLNRIRELGFSLKWFIPWNTLKLFDEEKALQFNRFDLLLESEPGGGQALVPLDSQGACD